MGVCCSGGGIRSAAYNLGALQVLQEKGELQKSRYLSSVSGGAYIAAGLAFVAKYSKSLDIDGKLVPPFASNSPEEPYLRNRSSYVAPGLKGKINLVATLVLTLSVNLGMIVMLLFIASRPLGHLYERGWHIFGRNVHALQPRLNTGRSKVVSVNLADWPAIWMIGGGAIVVAILLLLVRPPARWNHVTRFFAAWSRRVFLIDLFLFLVCVGLPFLIYLLKEVNGRETIVSRITLVGTTLSSLGLLSALAAAARKYRSKAALVAAVLIGPATLLWVFLAFVIDALVREKKANAELATISLWKRLFLADDFWFWLIWVGIFLLLYLVIDPTRTSGHPFYRRRLASAFCLERWRHPEGSVLAREIDYSKMTTLSKSQPERWANGDPHPELLVSAAANVSDRDVLPPGRNAVGFVFSAARIGGPMIGSVSTKFYEDSLPTGRRRDTTLMAGVAISGAAFAPSMGKMTRSYRFLMALLNIRLGVWLENPLRLNDRASALSRRFPGWLRKPRLRYLLKEMLGTNKVSAKYLYVTDGGHFENLGLVELLRRRCTKIYCFDASGGDEHEFFTLGEAIEIARADLDVEIDIDTSPMIPDEESGIAASDHVAGKISYPDGAGGKLVYARTVMTEGLPVDLQVYSQKNPKFPKDPTYDQLFDEAQFEAYRKLGSMAAERVLEGSVLRRFLQRI
ncbi:MAG: patatin-like phospholipase family protein [Actinomycetota bacterium]